MRAFVKMKTRSGAGSTRSRAPGQRESYLRDNADDAYHQEYSRWRPFRLVGLTSAFMALLFNALAISTDRWITTQTGVHSGIWATCYYQEDGYCPLHKTYWQNAVIGLMIFSVAFGILATILSVCGVCSSSLPQKIYYYHSAGEIFLVCALSCTAALVVYPVAITTEKKIGAFALGVGYGLGWGAAMFFLTSALCLCLDDLYRSASSTWCKCCFKQDSNSRV